MSKAYATYATYAATPIVLALSALSGGATRLVAQEHIRQPVVEVPTPQDYSTIVEVHIRQPALDDATIMAIFDNANTADIETGKLAVQRGHSSDVRQFGAMLARDHQMVRQQGRDMAMKLGIVPTSDEQSAEDHAAVMRRLSGLEGREFDSAFLKHEVLFHETAIAAIENTLLPAIANEELRAMVVKVAPAFKAHLDMARNLGIQLAAR
jgi:putative membrane protein